MYTVRFEIDPSNGGAHHCRLSVKGDKTLDEMEELIQAEAKEFCQREGIDSYKIDNLIRVWTS